ncbi:YbhB/YbcL family Raf kinase inhibitor-like protein [Desulfothermus okinawensis JCM 13304]
MILKSNSYPDQGLMPKKYVMKTIGGENISPEFTWENAPSETKSFVLIMVDPHPVARNWLHWAVIDIPSNLTSLKEGFSLSNSCSTCKELINSFGFRGYGGPQPPRGTGKHPYVTTIYALDVKEIKVRENPTYEELLKAISPHVLNKTSYTGYFEQK